MTTLDEFAKLVGTDVSPEVQQKTVRDILEFALTASEKQITTILLTGTDGVSRRIRVFGKDIIQGVILVKFLGKDVPPSIHRQTATCLANLSSTPENQLKIASYAGVLDALVNLLEKASGAVVHEQTARCLANLAQTQENHVKMASSVVLDALVKLLGKNGVAGVHQQTARCLTNLAGSEENRLRIASYSGALDALVRLLGKTGSTSVQQQVVICLTKLATLQDNQLKIVSYPGVLDALVRLLGEKRTVNVQFQSANCLTTLAYHYQSNKVVIASHPGVLDALVRLMKHHWATKDRISVQLRAALCLTSIASANQNLERVAFHDGVLDALVSCLGKLTKRCVRDLAAQCLRDLAAAQENREKIVCHPGALEALVRVLVQEVNSHGQEMATWCLSKLATAQETKGTIASFPGLLDALISLLRSSTTGTLEPAIRCLASLAVSIDNRVRIASHSGLLDALVRLLRNNVDPLVLEHTAKCLSYLALADKNSVRIASHNGALDAVVSLLGETRNIGVLEHTAKFLTNLAFSPENQLTIASNAGMLNALVKLLTTTNVSPSVQNEILSCLAKLLEVQENRAKIRSFPGAFDAVRELAFDDVNSSVQVVAKWCLATLNRNPATKIELSVGRNAPERRYLWQRESLSDPDDWFVDPLTYEKMCDPVKCNDGITYDRWTIIDFRLVRSPYNPSMTAFSIACDDVDVRRRLFLSYPQQEEKFRGLRQKYREEALHDAQEGKLENAIEKLNNVLKWAISDTECRNQLDNILKLVSEQSGSPLNAASQGLLLNRESEQENAEIQAVLPEDESLATLYPGEDETMIPVLKHDDLIKETEGRRKHFMLLVVLVCIGIWLVML